MIHAPMSIIGLCTAKEIYIMNVSDSKPLLQLLYTLYNIFYRVYRVQGRGRNESQK